MPNAAAIQAAFDSHEELLKGYMVPGNKLVSELYINLPLPWTIPQPVPEFDEASFVRKEWCTGDNPEDGDQFFGHQPPGNLDTLEKIMGTASPVTRWREANPDAVGTEQDVVRKIIREIERLLLEAGVERGTEMLQGYVSGVLLIVKKKA
jgi:hypothetical protein